MSTVRPDLSWFNYSHLPDRLQPVSRKFSHVALWIARNLPEGTETDMALRKLLEAKDCAVRAKFPDYDK